MKTVLISCAHCGSDYEIKIPISGTSQMEYSHKNGCKKITQAYINDGEIITTTKWFFFTKPGTVFLHQEYEKMVMNNES